MAAAEARGIRIALDVGLNAIADDAGAVMRCAGLADVFLPNTEELLRQAEYGDPGARERLLARHRDRLRKMIAWRLDRRLAEREREQ